MLVFPCQRIAENRAHPGAKLIARPVGTAVKGTQKNCGRFETAARHKAGAEGAGLGIPSQLMSSLPYLATVVVLVLISRARGTARSAAPASLGLVFVPDR